jgi:ABC-type glycerol-3-phosphate transport system permease component
VQIQFGQSIYVPRPFTEYTYSGSTRASAWLRNSAITAVVTVITTVIACLSGCAVARLRFPGFVSPRRASSDSLPRPARPSIHPALRPLAELGATNSLWSLFLSHPTFTVHSHLAPYGFFKALPTG